jgi:hypothetical protein
MKKQTLCRTLLFITLILFQFENELNAQVKQSPGHWYIKASGWPEYVDNNRVFHNGHVELQVSKRVHKFLEAGLSTALYSGYDDYSRGFLNFGAVGNWHFLPLLIDKENLRFEAYLSGKLGLVNYFQTNNNSQSVWGRYYIGTGVAYYLTRHLGVYFEYGYDLPFIEPMKLGYYKEMGIGISLRL